MRFLSTLMCCLWMTVPSLADTSSTPAGSNPVFQLRMGMNAPEDLTSWDGGVTLDTECKHSGSASATLRMETSGGLQTHLFITFPKADRPRSRLLRIRFFARTNGLENNQLAVRILKRFHDPQKPAEWFDYYTPDFLTVPVGSEWLLVQGEGSVSPDVKDVGVYILANNETGAGQLWFDDVEVELLDEGLLLQSGKPGNVFPAETGTISLAISSPENLASGTITLKNELGQTIQENPIPSGQPVVEIALPHRGYYEISAEATYKDGVKVRAYAPAAVVGPLIPDAVRMKSPFGLMGDGPLFFAAGARWDRPHRNLDEFIQARDSGYSIPEKKPFASPQLPTTSVYCFWPQPWWLLNAPAESKKSYDHMYPIKDPDEFTKLVQYVVQTIPGPVEYVEVANEPEVKWQGSLKELVEYHELMGRAVKSVKPQAKMAGPCLCTINLPLLQQLHQQGLFDHIDALSIHAYVQATPPEEEFIDRLRQLKTYLASIGKGDMEILITEFGWPIPPGDWQNPVTPLTQARYCSRSLVLMRAEEIDLIQWFNLYWGDPNGSAAAYGLLDGKWLPRPAYAAYANVTRQLSDTQGPGRVWNLTPTTYLAVFAAPENRAVAVAWDTRGESNAFVPGPRDTLRDMMGRPLANPDGDTLQVSPSPIFVTLPQQILYETKLTRTIQLSQGQIKSIGITPVWVPQPLSVTDGKVTVPSDAPAGKYSIFSQTADGLQRLCVNVIAPIELLSSELDWPMGTKAPTLRLQVLSNLKENATIKVQAKITSVPKPLRVSASIAPKQAATIHLPLPELAPGMRYRGQLQLRVEGHPGVRPITRPLDLTLLPCVPAGEKPVSMDISSWGPFGGSRNEPKTIPPEDCSATLEAGYDDRGLQLRISVRDNEHCQTQIPAKMWQEDSIQLAFDMDADKPWVANAGGFNGHLRVFEYGFALRDNGPMEWRWISGDPNIPAETSETRIVKSVKRKGDITTYELFIPWEVLGQKEKPKPGSTIGFSMVVNDYDGLGTERNGLKLFGGIVDQKDPKNFGRLYLR